MTPTYDALRAVADRASPLENAATIAAAHQRFGSEPAKARTLAAFLAQADALTALAAQIREAQTQLEEAA